MTDTDDGVNEKLDAFLIQIDALKAALKRSEDARKALWGKLALCILDRGGRARIDKGFAELTDLSKYELVEYTFENHGRREYCLEMREIKATDKTRGV